MKYSVLFICLLAASNPGRAQINSTEELNRYISNPVLVEENQLPAHVSCIPFEDTEQALTHDPARSKYFKSLNGNWKFKWTESPRKAPENFHLTDFDHSGWGEIHVPGTWQMQGFGYNVYRNVPMEFSPYDPPKVPLDFNPSGFYIKEFELPANWKERQTILHFDGVKAGFWLWVNGEYAGFDKGSMTPAEFDITPFLAEGKNKIAVQVVRWTDGSYLEDQDMWRFAGIYRRVYLYSLPDMYISDFFVNTDLDESYQNARLNIKCTIQGDTGNNYGSLYVKTFLYNDEGIEVTKIEGEIGSPGQEKTGEIILSSEVNAPKLWSAEDPNLYSLILTLENAEGDVLHVTREKVGFRELEIRNAQLLVNGVPVTIKGVNRHEHDPRQGRTMSRELIERDFQLMKELNINGIRTSHYPNDPLFYELADEWGFYICNEVNAECHYGQDYLAGQPIWETAFMDRTKRYFERDKNHPSVIMWSMGNECGLAPIHYQMAAWVKTADPGRFLYHQTNYPNGDAPFADICGTRYPNPAMLDAIGDTTQRPVILGEYAHAVGNSMGHFDEYWQRMYKYKSLQGGFIWDWVNQSLFTDLIATPDQSKYNHQAILMGRPKSVEGKNGKAIQLSGLDDFVEVTPHPALRVTGNEISLQAWVFPRGYRNTNTFISKGDHAFNLAQHHKDSLSFCIYTDRENRISTALPATWNERWHHVAGTYNGREMVLYIDGEPAASGPASGNIQRTRYEIMIGKNHEGEHENTPGFVSNAIIDEVMIHTAGLSREELSFDSPEPARQEQLVLWLPFEKMLDQGKFMCYGATPSASATMDGIIFADRTYQPESWQVKHSHSPVRIEALDSENGKFILHNRYDFTNLNKTYIQWILLADGKIIKEGRIDPELSPHRSRSLNIHEISGLKDASREHIVRLEYRMKEPSAWADKDYLIAFDEFPCGTSERKPKDDLQGTDSLAVFEEGDKLIISGEGFAYTFDRSKGMLEQVSYGRTDFFSAGPQLKVSRPPVVNEISTWTRAEYASWYEWGLDSLIHEVESVDYGRIPENGFLVRTKINSWSFREKSLQFNNVFVYRIDPSGTLEVEHDVVCHTELPDRRPKDDIPWIQKIGLEMMLAAGAEQYIWYGKGPFETYPDRQTGAMTGIYTASMDSVNMPYDITQGFGNHSSVRWLEIWHNEGAGMRFEGENPMNFSIDPYSNILDSWYPYQLKKSGKVRLNLDQRVSGVGGTPVTVRHSYRTYPDEYHYRFRISPAGN